MKLIDSIRACMSYVPRHEAVAWTKELEGMVGPHSELDHFGLLQAIDSTRLHTVLTVFLAVAAQANE